MPQALQLTVLDQSPIHPTDTAPGCANAAQMSVALARACDALGYARYWVAEHHNSPQFAGPSPEILVAAIASVTRHMRVGSGGVMLSHYSPYKVAEVFKLLAALFPGRIDLGIGRAPGGDRLAASALAWPGGPLEPEHYPAQAATLKGLLDGTLPAGHPWSGLHISPAIDTGPALWMLGSGGGSAALAGQLGMHLALARFISADHCHPEIFDAHTRAWHDAGHPGEPKRMLAIAAFCADTQAEAEHLAGTAIYRKMMMQAGGQDALLAPDAVHDARKAFSPSQQAQYDHIQRGYTIGTPNAAARTSTPSPRPSAPTRSRWSP
ncbi:MsnO8 family LLM class oxidoreductase [Nitrogeniibacter mangrovi]|uniref:MsnO8 family LLM class oxidoreductase n=1 Tax=Nitrogeniibacter mangrovi TaxID=2016596 RepID=UPI001C2D0165|nr:MsnO8 family LLM class oxidoreductase [Nitrogeniibacter mangrovi]